MESTINKAAEQATSEMRRMLVPLVLAQFVCSYAGTSTNVAINDIATGLGTDVAGVQACITLFTLTMAATMIPGSKLTDIWGRKFCFRLGLAVYGLGALIAASSQSLGVLMIGYSFLEGLGTSLLIPPVYILATVLVTGGARARAFGAISAAAGVGSAAGPLIGGLITSATSWRVNFVVQALMMLVVFLLGRRIVDPGLQGAKPRFDLLGAVLSAAGLFFIVVGILQAGTYGWFTAAQDFVIGGIVVLPQGSVSPVWLFELIGALLLFWFFRHIASTERAGKEPLLSPRMFQNRVSNLGLVTQNVQWLILQGFAFVVSVYLQTALGRNPIETGLILTPATIGILLTGMSAGRMAQRRSQTLLIRAGFLTTLSGMLLLLLLVSDTSGFLSFVPGLFLIGAGVGTMLTSSVNVVQSSFPEKDQGEISGLSRSVSNLGSSLGVAIAGTVIVSPLTSGNGGYLLAIVVLIVFGLIGFGASMLLPNKPAAEAVEASPSPA